MPDDPMSALTLLVVVVAFGTVVSFLLLFSMFFGPWLRMLLLGTPVSLVQLFAMRLRGTPLELVTRAYSRLKRRGEVETCAEVEMVYLEHRSKVIIDDDLVDIIRASHLNDQHETI